MIRKNILILIFLGLALNLSAQNIIQQAVKSIADNNLSIRAQVVENQIRELDDKSTLIPEDPEFGGAYLWGSPSYIGNRTNIDAHQKIKFPTYYVKQKKVNNLTADLYDIELDFVLNRVLFESFDLFVELAYLDSREELIRQRLERLNQIKIIAAGMFEAGETNRIELEKAQLLVDTYEQDLLMIFSGRLMIQTELATLNGGKTLSIDNVEYDGFEKIFANRKALGAQADNSRIEAAELNRRIAEAGIAVAKTSHLPDLRLGYISEEMAGDKVAGIGFGISIPVWGKTNQIKMAKLNTELNEKNLAITKLKVKSDWDNLSELARQSMEVKNNLSASLNSMETKDLLEKSWKLGEISLLDYLKELPFYYGVEDRLVEAEKQYYKALLSRNRNHLKLFVF